LLVEGDAVVVPDQLVTRRARQPADGEGEVDLGARRGMSALQLVEDEGLHLLLGDLPGLDVRPDLLGRELRVAGAEGDVHETDPRRRTIAWKGNKSHRISEVNMMALAQGGAWVIHGRMGLNRPFRNPKGVPESDEAALRQEIRDQGATNETVL